MTVFQSKTDFKDATLDRIDDELISAKEVLANITQDRRLCLRELSLRRNFAKWVKEALPSKCLTWGLVCKYNVDSMNRLYCNRQC